MQHIRLAITVSLCGAASFAANAQGPLLTIAPQSLASALTALARQSGRNIVFSPDALAGRSTRGVKGVRSISAALDALLKGSGLRYVIERDSSITVLPAAGKPVAIRKALRVAPSAPPVAEAEIVVTAQRRAQDVLDVPIALSLFSAKRLQALGVRDFDRLSRFTPGLVVEANSPAVSSFGMRGITQNSGDSTREPRVSVFQDGVSISAARSAYVELFDIERVEVVKGPQSTLYGRSAMTGAINLIQNKPSLSGIDWRGEIESGSRCHAIADAMVNVPLGDHAAIRIAGRLKHHDGYIANALGGDALGSDRSRAGRIALRWDATSRLRMDLIGNLEHDSGSGTPYKSILYVPTDPVTGAVKGDLDPRSAIAASSSTALGRPLGFRRTVRSITALIDFRLSDDFRLSATTAYRDFNSLGISDQDGIALPLYSYAEAARGTLYSQEVRLNYDRGGRFSAFAGINANRETGRQQTTNQFDERLMAAQFAGSISAPIPQSQAILTAPMFSARALQDLAILRGISLPEATARAIASRLDDAFLERNINRSRTTSIDAFADATWSPQETLEFTGGLRFSHDAKTSAISASLLNGPSALGGFIRALSAAPAIREAYLAQPEAFPSGLLLQPTADNGAWFADSMRDDGLSWRGAMRFKPVETTSFYASYARGRRPKVLTAGPPLSFGGLARFVQVPAETVDSWEIGGKMHDPTHGFSFGMALYHYAYRNFQTTIFERGALRATNAGRANAVGAEAELDWRPINELSLFATYAFNHARFASGAYRGNRFRLAPDHRASLGAIWTRPIANGALSITPLYTWQSKQFFNDNNDRPGLGGGLVDDTVQDEFQNGHGLFDLRLSFAPARGRWRIGAFVTNLFNQLHLKDAGVLGDGLGLPTLVAAAPRLWGLSLSLQP